MPVDERVGELPLQAHEFEPVRLELAAADAALTLIPSDLIEQAARAENWTDSDRQHCSRMLHQAFEESLEAEEIQRTVNGLIAYDTPFASFESVRFQQAAEKPVLQVEDLSKKLLLAKPE